MNGDDFLPVDTDTTPTSGLGFLAATVAVLLILCAPAFVWATYGWAFG